MSDFGGKHRYNVTGLLHDMWGFPTNKPDRIHKLMRNLVDKIESYASKICRHKRFNLEDAESILISYGSSARTSLEVVRYSRHRGRKVGLLELQTLWPFPTELVKEVCANARHVIVVEMNMGQIVHQVKAALNNPDNVFLCNRYDGNLIHFDDIRNMLRIVKGKGL